MYLKRKFFPARIKWWGQTLARTSSTHTSVCVSVLLCLCVTFLYIERFPKFTLKFPLNIVWVSTFKHIFPLLPLCRKSCRNTTNFFLFFINFSVYLYIHGQWNYFFPNLVFSDQPYDHLQQAREQRSSEMHPTRRLGGVRENSVGKEKHSLLQAGCSMLWCNRWFVEFSCNRKIETSKAMRFGWEFGAGSLLVSAKSLSKLLLFI